MYSVGERHGIQTRVRNTKLMFMHLMHRYKLPDVDIAWVSVGKQLRSGSFSSRVTCRNIFKPLTADIVIPADDGVMEVDAGRSNDCQEQGPVFVMTKQPQHDHCIMYPDFTFWDWEGVIHEA